MNTEYNKYLDYIDFETIKTINEIKMIEYGDYNKKSKHHVGYRSVSKSIPNNRNALCSCGSGKKYKKCCL